MEFLIGGLVGFTVAGLIGRAKFLQVQTKLREALDTIRSRNYDLLIERNLFAGLTQEFDALVAKTRRVSL